MALGTIKNPTVFDELYEGRFLKAGLLKNKPRTLTISRVFVETLADDASKTGEKNRGIICFKETERQLCINRTNGESIRAMFGASVQGWVGKQITLVPEMAKFGREDVEAIRVSGSPDIDHAINIEIKMPKRKPMLRKLVPTGKSNNPVPQPEPPKQEETPVVADSDGVVQSETETKQEEVKE